MGFVLRRTAARVICRDPAGRIVLIRSTDPADPRIPPWWELPGGGIEAGETAEDACLRELREEVGISDAVIGPCVFTQHAQFSFSGWEFDQHERIHLAESSGNIDSHTRLEAFEAIAFQGIRWWEVDQFLTDSSPTVPPRLREFLPRALDGSITEPLDITP